MFPKQGVLQLIYLSFSLCCDHLSGLVLPGVAGVKCGGDGVMSVDFFGAPCIPDGSNLLIADSNNE